MNAVLALLDDLENLVDADLAGIVDFQGATRTQAEGEDRENDRLENWLVLLVERTVDKYARGVPTWPHWTPAFSCAEAERPLLS